MLVSLLSVTPFLYNCCLVGAGGGGGFCCMVMVILLKGAHFTALCDSLSLRLLSLFGRGAVAW